MPIAGSATAASMETATTSATRRWCRSRAAGLEYLRIMAPVCQGPRGERATAPVSAPCQAAAACHSPRRPGASEPSGGLERQVQVGEGGRERLGHLVQDLGAVPPQHDGRCGPFELGALDGRGVEQRG